MPARGLRAPALDSTLVARAWPLRGWFVPGLLLGLGCAPHPPPEPDGAPAPPVVPAPAAEPAPPGPASPEPGPDLGAIPAAAPPDPVEPLAPSDGSWADMELGELAIDWIELEGGTVLMRDDRGSAGDPGLEHRVPVERFWIARHEVTQGQYERCVQVGACDAPDPRCIVDAGRSPAKFQGADQPVVCVSWAEALAFARWVGGDLPSEAEWTWAATSRGASGATPWGAGSATCARVVMNWGCGKDAPWPVCSLPKGHSKQGVCDLIGNVAEWMGEIAPWDHDSVLPGVRVNRGGSWWGVDPPFYRSPGARGPSQLHAHHRSRYAADLRGPELGFRPVRRTPPPSWR